MPNRIDTCFANLRGRGEKGFIAYICAGDPDFARTVELAHALERAGTDILELGVPFSDPLADGIVNQLAAQRALAAGATVRGVLDCVREIRRDSQMPIVLYTYLNPIVQFGLREFYREAEVAGVDGLLMLDLPPEEDLEPPNECLAHIRLIAPTTPQKRVAQICARGEGFIYYVSREGVTGAQAEVADSLGEKVAAIRACTPLPIAVGFGISTPAQAAAAAAHVDAVVVGSALVDEIGRGGDGMVARVRERAQALARAAKSD